jgi:hydrogenase assembly chaperone HypC/HupF
MCLSVPIKILKIKNNKAIAGFMGRKEEFDIGLVPDIKINDYALASNGFIVKKISAEEAGEIFKIIKPAKGGKKSKKEGK